MIPACRGAMRQSQIRLKADRSSGQLAKTSRAGSNPAYECAQGRHLPARHRPAALYSHFLLEPVLKFKMSEESSQAAELNADHGDIDPRFGAGLRGLIIAHQSPLAHEPAEGAFHYPAARQDFEASGIIGAFDDLDRQLGSEPLDPLGERFTGVAAVHPQDAEPGEPAQHPAQHQLRAVSFGGAGGSHDHAKHQPQGVHQQMALAASFLIRLPAS